MIIVSGDSHVQQFMGRNPICAGYPSCVSKDPFKCFWLGPRTCWHFMKNCKDQLLNILGEHWRTGDRLVVSCGEIDCRRHVVRQANLRNVSIEVVAAEVAARYMEIMEEFKAWRPIALGLPPQMDAPQKDYEPQGSTKERNVAINCFNEIISKHVPFWASPGQEDQSLVLDKVHVIGDHARSIFLRLEKEIEK
jgi:hypothetical protein